MKLNVENKKLVLMGGTVLVILILDFINGSTYRFLELAWPECLATHVFQLSCLFMLITVFINKDYKKKARKIILAIGISSVIALLVEPTITKYQYQETRNSLEKICEALTQYKNDKGEYPPYLIDLKPAYLKEIPKSGFGILDSKILYTRHSGEKVILKYKVHFGYICLSSACGGGVSFISGANC